jgi:hypothetical protein
VSNVTEKPDMAVYARGGLLLGGDDGFEASIVGEIYIVQRSMELSLKHEGGWSPVDWFTSPAFEGRVAYNIEELDPLTGESKVVPLRAYANVVAAEPIEIMDVLSLRDIPPLNASDNATIGGPSFAVSIVKEDANGSTAFTVDFSGMVIIGGSSGFNASIIGSLDSGAKSADLQFSHGGGWSPLPGELANYFRTPIFEGSLRMNMPSAADPQSLTYIDARATATFATPITLSPGKLVLTGLPPYNTTGPFIDLSLIKETAEHAYTYDVAVAGAVYLSNSPPFALNGSFTMGGGFANKSTPAGNFSLKDSIGALFQTAASAAGRRLNEVDANALEELGVNLTFADKARDAEGNWTKNKQV